MRLKMARAVEGCWYRRLKVVPGSLSRYSKEAREDTDILTFSLASIWDFCYRFIMVIGMFGGQKFEGIALHPS